MKILDPNSLNMEQLKEFLQSNFDQFLKNQQDNQKVQQESQQNYHEYTKKSISELTQYIKDSFQIKEVLGNDASDKSGNDGDEKKININRSKMDQQKAIEDGKPYDIIIHQEGDVVILPSSAFVMLPPTVITPFKEIIQNIINFDTNIFLFKNQQDTVVFPTDFSIKDGTNNDMKNAQVNYDLIISFQNSVTLENIQVRDCFELLRKSFSDSSVKLFLRDALVYYKQSNPEHCLYDLFVAHLLKYYPVEEIYRDARLVFISELSRKDRLSLQWFWKNSKFLTRPQNSSYVKSFAQKFVKEVRALKQNQSCGYSQGYDLYCSSFQEQNIKLLEQKYSKGHKVEISLPELQADILKIYSESYKQ